MKALVSGMLVPLLLSAFIYLALIIPVESFMCRLPTVRFKRWLFVVSLMLAYALMFGLSLFGRE